MHTPHNDLFTLPQVFHIPKLTIVNERNKTKTKQNKIHTQTNTPRQSVCTFGENSIEAAFRQKRFSRILTYYGTPCLCVSVYSNSFQEFPNRNEEHLFIYFIKQTKIIILISYYISLYGIVFSCHLTAVNHLD